MKRPVGWLLGIVLLSTAAFARTPEIVKTDSGPVQGVTTGEITSFKGIPFATPPVGHLRWRAPQPVAPWTELRKADRFGPACLQPSDIKPQSEDCLTLNVFRPADADGPLPVMVWIHGGGLWTGTASNYPADSLARQGIIVVTVNYRLGRLGFFALPKLSTESPDEPHGNYGHLDQLAALQWIQRNIAAFGGDPAKVTIFGESAGGGSVMAHLMSPLSRGLFRAAIMQSPGSPTGRDRAIPLTPLADAQKIAEEYARSLGIDDRGPAMLAALRALPGEKLVEGEEPYLDALAKGVPLPGVAGAIIDGQFVTETSEQAFAKGHQAKVPIIVGANSRDLGLGVAESKDELFALFGSLAADARRAYDPDDKQTLEELKARVFADKTMVEPVRHLADVAARSGQPTWLYRFSYVTEALRPKLPGTPHAFEIPYVFGDAGVYPPMLLGHKTTAADDTMAKAVSAYWVAFAKTGDPNSAGSIEWPQHEAGVDRLIHFTNAGIVVGPDPIRSRLDLWQKVRETGSP